MLANEYRPAYARVVRNYAAWSAEDQAVLTYLASERPFGWQGWDAPGLDSAAAARFRAAYRRLASTAKEVAPMDDRRAALLAHCADFVGLPYRLDPPPDGVTSLDCSLYVLQVFAAAGLPFPAGVRTAEQIRAVCDPVAWDAVQPGDLLFFEHTYEPSEASAVGDGHVATHVGISLGGGTKRMWDCHARAGSAVGQTDISTDYWQAKLLEARRPRQLGTSALSHSPETPAGADLAAQLAAEREWGSALQTEIARWADQLEGAWWSGDLEAFTAVLSTMRRNAS